MKVLKRKSGYSQDPTRYFDLARFQKKCDDFVLIEAGFEGHSLWKEYDLEENELKEILKHKIVRLETEEPNKFFIGDNPSTYDYQFYKIFTICPYTARWLNKKQHTRKHVPIFFPFNEEYIPEKHKKRYDIIYTGHILSRSVYDYIKTISKFNYRLVSNSEDSLVTNRGATYVEKMKLIAESKITLVANLLYLRPYHLFNLWKTPNYKDNGAFKLVPKWYEIDKWLNREIIVPQIKSRLFEAAFGRSLILCRKDPFSLIERYFEPDREFVYFDNGNLEETIKHVLNNYSFYEKVVERAYWKAVNNYTTEKFVERYLKGLG